MKSWRTRKNDLHNRTTKSCMKMSQSVVASPAVECDTDFETIAVVVVAAAAVVGEAAVDADKLDVCSAASNSDRPNNFFRNNLAAR